MKLWEMFSSDNMATIAEGLDIYYSRKQNAEHKRFAEKAEQYYQGEHDIKDTKIFYIDDYGEPHEDTSASNIKIPHQFFTELVDQKVQHLLSEPVQFITENRKLEERLNEYLNEDFNLFLDEIVEGSSVKGVEFAYARTTSDDLLKFETSDYLNTDTITNNLNEEVAVVRTYTQIVDRDGENSTLIYGEVHREKDVAYFVKEENDNFKPDRSEDPNPRQHVIARGSEDDRRIYERSYGRIPFYRLANNRKETSDLKPIKELIDDYDIMASFISNDLQDFGRPIYVVSGYQGSTRDEIRNKIKSGIIGTGAPNTKGGLEVRGFDVPYEARKAKLDIDREAIYKFGMGFDSSKNDGSNITNVVIESRYSLLNMKCNKMEPRLRGLIRWCLELVIEDIQRKYKENYDINEITVEIDRNTLMNANDEADRELTEAQAKQTIVNTLVIAQPYIGDTQITEKICDMFDIDIKDVVLAMEEDSYYSMDNETELIENGETE